jgi:8-oxo-dGTP pyrophosphatase MutT (NUDIX family)
MSTNTTLQGGVSRSKKNMIINISLSKYLDTTGVGRAMLQYAGKGYYIHFGQTTKLGVSTRHNHSDFEGIYFYSLDWLIGEQSNKNLYDQYALTFPYYTIVKINHTKSGIRLQNFCLTHMQSIVEGASLHSVYDEWRSNRVGSSTRLTHAEQEQADFAALDATGFYGKRGAGGICYCPSTKRHLLLHRSRSVEQPGTWGIAGGAIDSDELPVQAVEREMLEELGVKVKHDKPVLIHIFKDSKSSFQYYNYLVTVKEEFVPKLNWESQGYAWVTLADMTKLNLHFGVKELLTNKCLSSVQHSTSSNEDAVTILFDFYKYCKEHKIKNNMLQGIDYIEDDGFGYFNKNEKYQIVVRNTRIITVIESGETKTKLTDTLAFYHKCLVATCGKPTTVRSTKNNGNVVGLALEYKPYADYKSIKFTFYPGHDAGVIDSWLLEATYQVWIYSEYDKGPNIRYISAKLTMGKEDDIYKLTEFVETQYSTYKKASNLVEDKWSEYNVKYMREDLDRYIPLQDTNFISNNGIKNLWLTEYVNGILKTKFEGITDAQIWSEISVLDPSNADVIADDYRNIDMYTVSRSSKVAYRRIKSLLPKKRFDAFIKHAIKEMSQYLTNDNLNDVFKQLNS